MSNSETHLVKHHIPDIVTLSKHMSAVFYGTNAVNWGLTAEHKWLNFTYVQHENDAKQSSVKIHTNHTNIQVGTDISKMYFIIMRKGKEYKMVQQQ